jgi:glycosyltransferase involved in cell wall biosynthesis
MPKVSVIITTYNRAHFLPQAIESVLSQTYDDYELIIIDDGSTDNTADVVARYHDPRIHYHWQENQERSAARNRGTTLSRGQYLTFLDVDDQYLPHKLAGEVATLDTSPEVGMAASGWLVVDATGKLIQEEQPWYRCSRPTLPDWLLSYLTRIGANLLRREWLEKVGGFDLDLSHHEDTYLWFRLIWAGCTVKWNKTSVMIHSIHPANTMHNVHAMRNGHLKMLSKIYDIPEVAAALGRSSEEAFAEAYLENSFRLYATGQTEEAQADMSKAIQMAPAWLDNNGEGILQGMWAWANNPLIDAPKAFMEIILNHLPQELAHIKWNKSQVIAGAWITKAFDAYRHGQMKTVRQALAKALIIYPGWIRNRGVVSIGMKSIVGRWMRS